MSAAAQPTTQPRIQPVLLRWGPELAGAAWFIFLAWAIWKHSHASQQPPLYDAFTYYQKAYNFWTAVAAGRWFNPLDLASTFRPPGTVAMSYPFGFDADPRGFFFRSVFLPVALLAGAVLVACYRASADLGVRWRIVLTAVFFSTTTLPYQFEMALPPSDSGYWGLVDSFLAGVAAVAAAAAWRGARDGGWAWISATALLSALAIVVKPSGTLVAALAGLAWVVFAAARFFEIRTAPEWSGRQRLRLVRRLIAGALAIGLVDALMLLAALESRYLSRDNLQFGQANIAVMRAELTLPLHVLWRVADAGLGVFLLLWIALALLVVAVSSALAALGGETRDSQRTTSATAMALFAFVFGAWFWLIAAAGATQIRYGIPFFAMAMVWLLPATLRAWRSAAWPASGAMTVLMAASTLNLGSLLALPRPAVGWQALSGVALGAGTKPPEQAVLRALVDARRTAPVVVYGFCLDNNDALLEGLADQFWLLHQQVPPLTVRRPVDWLRSSTFRLDEVLAADYWMIAPLQGQWASPPGKVVDSLSAEQGVLTAWAAALAPAEGVIVQAEVGTVKLLRVVDRTALRASLGGLVASRRWRTAFLEANGGWLR